MISSLNIIKPSTFESGVLQVVYPIVNQADASESTKKISAKLSPKKLKRVQIQNKRKASDVLSTCLKIDQATLIHFGGRKVGADERVYTRSILGKDEETSLAEE